MIWRYNEQEIGCNEKYTLFPVLGIIGKVQLRYSNNQVICKQEQCGGQRSRKLNNN